MGEQRRTAASSFDFWLAIAGLAFGAGLLISDVLAVYDLGTWLDENATGKGSPSLVPYLLVGALAVLIIAAGFVALDRAATRRRRRA